MPTVVIPKNMASNCHFNNFLSISASGIESVTVAVIKASAVPIGTPFPTRASMMGITLTELAYNGIPSKTAVGTPHQEEPDKAVLINDSGTNP